MPHRQRVQPSACAPRRVLLTGHLGYLGSVIAAVLGAAGHHVTGLDSGLFADCLHGPAPAPVPELRRDLRDVQRSDLAGFDAVLHLAALSNDPLGDLAPEHTFAINGTASLRLAEMAKAAGVTRFLYASSCSIYGAASTDAVLDETAPMRPVTPYAKSKVEVEAGLQALADARFSPTSMRNATAFGWSPRLRLDLVLNDLVARALLHRRIVVLSDGTPWRPLVHARDVAAAFLCALEAPRDAVHDIALNVGGAAQNHQVRDIAAIVAQAVGGCEVSITGETGPDPRSYRVDFTRIGERLPAFAPRWSAAEGVRELVDAFWRHGLDEDGFARRYRRLPWLSELRQSGAVDDSLRPVAVAA